MGGVTLRSVELCGTGDCGREGRSLIFAASITLWIVCSTVSHAPVFRSRRHKAQPASFLGYRFRADRGRAQILPRLDYFLFLSSRFVEKRRENGPLLGVLQSGTRFSTEKINFSRFYAPI
jgi:hypothetical protein